MRADGFDLYFGCRLALLDHPDARIRCESLDGRHGGGYEVSVRDSRWQLHGRIDGMALAVDGLPAIEFVARKLAAHWEARPSAGSSTLGAT